MRFSTFNFQSSKGFTFVEVLVGIALLVILFIGLYGAFQFGLKVVGQSKARVSAIALGNQKLEEIRNLPYKDIGTVGGIPPGVIAETETINRNKIDFTVKTTVIYVDDPFDGLAPVDTLPTDYKRSRVKVSWSGYFGGEVVLITDVAPKGVETEAGGGTLKISVFSASGAGVAGADIHIVNNQVAPNIDVTYQSDDSGNFVAAGAPTSTEGYQITVTKTGFSQDRTYGREEVANPSKPHASVFEGQVTEISFSIDTLSSFSVETRALAGLTYYVRKSGSDSNDGLSSPTAFLTIQKAASVMQPGDRVYVGAGVYNETIVPVNSGRDRLPISYIADTGGAATGDAGDVIIDGENTRCEAFRLNNGISYLVIEGFIGTNHPDCGGNDATFRGLGGNNNNIFRNIVAHDTGRDAFDLFGQNNLLENCLFYDLYDDGMEMNGINNTIRNCTIVRPAQHALEPEVAGNTWENNILDGPIEIADSLDLTNDTWLYNDWLQGSLPGMGNIQADPLFVTTTDFRLSQVAAGQSVDSPAVDAGSDLASAFNLDTQTTRTDNAPDSGQVDMGYHYIVSHPPAPSPPGDIFIPNVAFKLQGSKIIGTDINDQPVYKYSAEHISDSSGRINIPDLEWDAYTFSAVTSTNMDLAYTSPAPQPISLLPGTTTDVTLYFKAENSLLVIVEDATTTDPIFGASVRVSNTGLSYNESRPTDEQGRALFLPLEVATYDLEVQQTGYQTVTTTVDVLGDTIKVISLESL